jgi:hypothetical protein
VPSGIARLLELLYSSDSRWRTLRAEGTEWRNHTLLQEAWDIQIHRRHGSGHGRSHVFRAVSDSPGPEEATESWKLWISPRFTRAQFPVGRDVVDVVYEGSTWRSVSNGRARTNSGDASHSHGLGWGEDLIRTRRYIPFLEFQEIQEVVFNGRDAIVAEAVPGWTEEFESGRVLHGLVIGDPDKVALTVDADRGVILRTEARLGGVPYRTVEMTDVRFDEEFEADAFTINPPSGKDWESA